MPRKDVSPLRVIFIQGLWESSRAPSHTHTMNNALSKFSMWRNGIKLKVPGPMRISIFILVTWMIPPSIAADWPTLRGNVERTGYVDGKIQPPFQVEWVRFFYDERLGTAMEPIVGEGKVFLATHQGNVYALRADTGEPLWRFHTNSTVLHSPAYAEGVVIAADTHGTLYALDATNGKLRWSAPTGPGGCSVSPLIAGGRVFIGTRSGEMLGVRLEDGKVHWRKPLGAPIRQTAAYLEPYVYVTSEDLRAHCLRGESGEIQWSSKPFYGQTARDYYPVLAQTREGLRVLIRTNPLLTMSDHIGRDRRFLAQNAGVDDSTWQSLDAWSKSPAAIGDATKWTEESRGVSRYLAQTPSARTFFALDAETGQENQTAPVLWCAGCEGTGTPPVIQPDGNAMVLYRSAYGNWNHGVAPLVALGRYDPVSNLVTPFLHRHGSQPPWNTFWGTADESQNYVQVGQTILIVHQGTLSWFDLESGSLRLIAGNRDTFGGFLNLPWARNEWHGPARGGVAVTESHLYWLTGSRIFCIAYGPAAESVTKQEKQDQSVQDRGIHGDCVPGESAPPTVLPSLEQLRSRLADAVEECISQRWAPLYVNAGLAGAEYFFDDSGDVMESLAWAFPILPGDLQQRVKSYLAGEWEQHPPYSENAWYSVEAGARREAFLLPPDVLERRPTYRKPHPFGNLYAVWLYAERCGEGQKVLTAWPSLQACYRDFRQTGWTLDPAKGDLFANRYLASLIAFRNLAEKAGDSAAQKEAQALIQEWSENLSAWWKATAQRAELPVFKNVLEFDTYRNQGEDAIFFKSQGHNAKPFLFQELTPDVAEIVRKNVSAAFLSYWKTFERVCPTWALLGEERQVHYGENFTDFPDFALAAFKAKTWLMKAPLDELVPYLDIPWCRADLNYVVKLSLVLERGSGEEAG